MIKLISCSVVLLCITLTTAAKDYLGAELYSKNTVKYGRFDIRMRMVSGNGIVSSFFLYYDNSYKGSPEPWQEIDVEVIGKISNGFQSNVITGSLESKTTSEKSHTGFNLSQAYHTYTVEWTPDYIAWFLDGTQLRRVTGEQVTDCRPKEMSYRFNLWISDAASWAGQFNESVLPVYQFINWVRYSRYSPGSGTNGTDFTPDWQDEFDTFNSSRWAKGDWTFDGNLVDFSPNNITVKDGYCIICLTKTGAAGFTGEVPADQSTSTLDGQLKTVFRISPVGYPGLREMVIVSLSGRLLPRKAESSYNISPGISIFKETGSVGRTIDLSRY